MQNKFDKKDIVAAHVVATMFAIAALPLLASANGYSESQKYRTEMPITFANIAVMSTVELPYNSAFMSGQVGIYDTTSNEFVPYDTRMSYRSATHPTFRASAESYPDGVSKWGIGSALSDDDTDTTITLYPSRGAVPSPTKVSTTGGGDIIIHATQGDGGTSADVKILGGQNQVAPQEAGTDRVRIKLDSENPFSTSNFRIATTNGRIDAVAIEAVVDGVRRTIVSERAIYGNSVNFIPTTAKEWYLTIKYSDVVRISEITPDASSGPSTRPEAVRFLATPGDAYVLLSDASMPVNQRLPAHGNLLDDMKVTAATLGAANANPGYQTLDTDGDGIPDVHDNCQSVANNDQEDKDGNSIGDACEDFDHDGILNSKDSCPLVYNPGQADADADGIGDLCDPVDDRAGPVAPWLPYAGLGAAAVVLGVLGYLTIKMPKPNVNTEGNENQS